jgi:protease-4
MQDEHWERDALKQVALEAIREQRRARRWGIFFKLALLVYITALLLMTTTCQLGAAGTTGPHTAVVSVDGIIMEGSPASAELLIEGLQAAFEAENVAGVVLRINSPGGSPVQAGMVNNEIRRLRALHPQIPVYAVVSDLGASGAYYIAVAADRIYVNRASLVGSIGVLMDGFGFTGTMEKLGVERRMYTAGQSKGFLDPFSPVQRRDVAHVNAILEDIHRQFIEVVKRGRGDRLVGGDELFSGLVWTGEQSIRIGLADELNDLHGVARDVIGAETLIDYTPSQDILSRFADRLGASAARELAVQVRGWRFW